MVGTNLSCKHNVLVYIVELAMTSQSAGQREMISVYVAHLLLNNRPSPDWRIPIMCLRYTYYMNIIIFQLPFSHELRYNNNNI